MGNTAELELESQQDGGVATEQAPAESQTKPKRQPLYNVVIWNDETHTYDYVIELLMTLFGHPFEKAYQITREVDKSGKGIAYTTHMELAELKRDQVLGYGADWRMAISEGSIRASIEPTV